MTGTPWTPPEAIVVPMGQLGVRLSEQEHATRSVASRARRQARANAQRAFTERHSSNPDMTWEELIAIQPYPWGADPADAADTYVFVVGNKLQDGT